MRNYYRGRHARHYNTRWRTFTERTLAHVLFMLERTALSAKSTQGERRLRILDVACGTGILLQQITQRVPDVEAVGVDASQDMLAQARRAFQNQPQVHLEHAQIGAGKRANLPYAPASFDVITCANTLHDLPYPVETLKGLKELLTSEGMLVLEDYARRSPPFPWPLFERLLRSTEGTYVRAYTLAEAQTLCAQAGFQVIDEQAFTVDWLWHGWVISAGTTCS